MENRTHIPLRLGVAGLGTVGGGLVSIVQNHADLLKNRSGRTVEIACVSARNRDKDRGVDLSAYDWLDNPQDMAARDDVDVVVELIGGSEGPACDLVKAALSNKKHIVTANKALLAHHGYELAKLAEDNGVSLAYEAAIAGGIPVVRALREGLAGNAINAVYGILNGTCNYILTAMRKTGRDFEDILKEAQECGYAEADPSFDIDGIDAGHKLCLLSALAFGVRPDFENLKITGIRKITGTDIHYAGELGYRIKLLGIARREGDKYLQMLEPCLVPVSNPIGTIEDVYNAVYIEGDAVETVLLTGKGAGAGPTASAVMGDIMDLACGAARPAFGVPAASLENAGWMNVNDSASCYYLRLSVREQAGVIADMAGIFRDLDISIESLIQHGHAPAPGEAVSIVLTTHQTRHGNMLKACRLIAELDVVLDEPCLLRIEELE